MPSKKLVVSGLPAANLKQFNDLLDEVRAIVEPSVRNKIDGSVLARFAITNLLSCYGDDARRLASQLGFEVKIYE